MGRWRLSQHQCWFLICSWLILCQLNPWLLKGVCPEEHSWVSLRTPLKILKVCRPALHVSQSFCRHQLLSWMCFCHFFSWTFSLCVIIIIRIIVMIICLGKCGSTRGHKLTNPGLPCLEITPRILFWLTDDSLHENPLRRKRRRAPVPSSTLVYAFRTFQPEYEVKKTLQMQLKKTDKDLIVSFSKAFLNCECRRAK